MSAALEVTDLELIALARTGDRDAYGRLVSRHQTLVASLAYSICGDFARSQDIAQEAFIAAWRQLASLEDAAKFKGWLCGITRNLGRNFIRQKTRRADQSAASAEATPESAADTPGPHEHAVTREESAIVWSALEKLPEDYREPLILFYREHQSIERVAAALDLSEDNVKQRLSRGRAMLRDRVENVIERSLGFTTPGVMFTTAVLGALPAATLPIAAATTAGAAAKATLSLSIFSMVISPLVWLIALFSFRRQALRLTPSPTDRVFVKRLYAILGTLVLLIFAGMFARIWQIRSPPVSESPVWWMPGGVAWGMLIM
ncbi:MAG: sigma-70 family RNA polymerase sigma factor, partial [Opitutaceae bacterium]